VVNRQTWHFEPNALAWAHEANATERFVAARRWAQAQGLPRFVFVKVPIEVKPFYVDFDSPVYVNILAKTIRRTQEAAESERQVTISEMLPSLEQTWLPDAEGRRYTSELRIVAVDLNP
jgi:hypothetical protein